MHTSIKFNVDESLESFLLRLSQDQGYERFSHFAQDGLIDTDKTKFEWRDVADFELITTKEDVVAEKPAGDIYKYALEKFRLKPTEVIAVEDTEINQSAALQEEIFCYLFAGEYATTQHNINAVRTMATVTRQLK